MAGPKSPKLQSYLEHFITESQNPHLGTATALRKAIAEFPDESTLYNYLHVTLTQENKEGEARKLLVDLLERFPNYHFGKLMLARQRLYDNDLAGARRALNNTVDIRAFLPGSEIIHQSIFQAFHRLLGEIELKSGQLEVAKDHLRLLLQLDPESQHTQQLGLNIFQAGALKTIFSRKEAAGQLATVEAKPSGKYLPTLETPVLNHPEMGELMLLPPDSMPERVQQVLLALPRETLVADLCTLLIDSIRRLPYYLDDDSDTVGSQAIHALAYLALLKAEAALPVVFDTLCEGEAYREYWFGDYADLSYTWYLTVVAEHNLDAFQAFARTRNLDWLDKSHVTRAVAQMGQHWPELRPQAIAWFSNLFQYLLDHAADKDLIDATFITFTMSEAVDLRAVELLPLFRELDQKGWIDVQMMGDLTKMEAIISLEPDPFDKEPRPLDLDDFYSDNYLDRREATNRQFDLPFDEGDPVEAYLMSMMMEMLTHQKEADEEAEGYWAPPLPPVETFRRTVPKVGRNESCPCGSGKKYKRCHGKDA